MKLNYGYMRSQGAGRNSSQVYRPAKPAWARMMQKTYLMIEEDVQDSAMLQRFPELRKYKDEGNDVRTQVYTSPEPPEDRNSSKAQSRLDVMNLDSELLKDMRQSQGSERGSVRDNESQAQ